MALLHLIALLGGGAAKIGGLRFAVIGAGYSREGERLLAPDIPSSAAMDRAEQLSQLALDEFPYDTSSWTRLAYIDRLRHGHLTQTGASALARSYDLVAVDPNIGAWRVHFALENWDKLPKSLKESAREEAEAMATDGSGKVKLRAALKAVRAPVGATLAALWLQRYVANPSYPEHSTPEKAAKPGSLLKD
ncbi:MAG: hypothetical protein WA047_15220 [Phenylobacterium sp.]|uniref:hypothetical protein n=1 Tax=Phenylobacterium sp. TaxID=1871053 RepID=UPI003BB7715E